MKTNQTHRFFCTFLLLLCCAWSAWIQEHPSFFERVSNAEILEIEIATDLSLLRDQRNTNIYQEAVLSYSRGKKEEESWNIHLRSRGKFRRRACVFPPLKLKFQKAELKKLGLNSDNEFKLVTHCVEGDIGKDYVLREYLAYKLFEALSPNHFSVQLTKVRYKDIHTNERLSGFGILLEDEKALERRFHGDICSDCFGFPKNAFQKENLGIVYLFQYFISNTDWNTAMVRNLILLRPKEGSGAVLVPYDFDFSGFVNATYATPNADFKQKSIRDRVFIGAELSDSELQQAIAYFKEKRPVIEALISSFKQLSSTSREDLLQFVDSFYSSLDGGIKRP